MFLFSLFFFNDTAPTEISTLSLHDALPISAAADSAAAGAGLFRTAAAGRAAAGADGRRRRHRAAVGVRPRADQDRKSTRLNSSHTVISYAVFCLKKKKKKKVKKTYKCRKEE